jgi:hypothetical protein
MRTDVHKWPFMAIGQGGVIADVDVGDAFQVGFAIDVDTVAGTPTNFRAVAIPLADQALGTATDHLRKTPDLTAAGTAILGQRSTAIAEPAIENIYGKIRVIADFTGGTAPTITGNLYVFSKRF